MHCCRGDDMSDLETIKNKAVARLTALMAAGYELMAPTSSSEAVSLEHPSRKFKYRHAYVYDDGRVVAPFSDKDEVRIYTDSTDSEFHTFISTVPKPTDWEKATAANFWSGVIAGLGAAVAVYFLFVR